MTEGQERKPPNSITQQQIANQNLFPIFGFK